MEIALYNRSGKAEGKIAVSDKLFGAKMKADLVYQIATSMMSNKRQVVAHTKTRSEVSGGGKKPWRQKGTGRARHGSIRSPIWVGGGVAHGPTKDVNFKKKINRVQARAALASVLSARAKEGHLAVVEGLEVSSGKTKDAVKLLSGLVKGLKDYSAGKRVLVVLSGTPDDAGVRRATQNLKFADTIRAQDLNTLTVLSYPFVLLAREAVEGVERMFAPKATTR